jgi:hypothetical protein
VFYSLEKLGQHDIKTAFKKMTSWIKKNQVEHGRGELSLFPLEISPTHMFKENKLFKIKDCNDNFKINGLTFITKNNKVQSIKIMNGVHPNMNPKTREYCIDEQLKNKQFDISYLFMIISLIETWHLNNCFRKPNPKHYKIIEMPKIGGITAHELNESI